MSEKSQKSTRRTWGEIAGMLTLACFALSCVAAVNHTLEAELSKASSITVKSQAPIPPEDDEKPEMVMITSPTAGIFQAGNTEGGPALAKLGMQVKPETILGNIEPMDATAMPILAGVMGTIKEIYVEDQSVVRKGEALIKIEIKELNEMPEDSLR